MSITKSRTFKMAFLVDADSLRRLSKLLQESVLDRMPEDSDRRITCKVDLSDGSSVDKASVEDVHLCLIAASGR
jgi:hypothetical protein